MPSFRYRVEGANAVHSGKHVLHLFLFLERRASLLHRTGANNSSTASGMKGTNDQWAFLMDLTASVRSNFFMAASRCADGIPKVVHSALNKLFHNHSASAEVQCSI